jgi:alcohol dehydrogenase, propanol-preferring
MKAAVLHEFKTPLTFQEVDSPKPQDEDVLIEVEACGVCHSDLHVASGDWPQFAKMVKKPLILGHEVAGRVVETGARVRNLQRGDRVGVPWLYWSCGDCEQCREGNENLCSRQKITGVTVDGGYAEFMTAPASHAVKIPDGLLAVEAAPLFCAGVTVYRALKRAQVWPGQRLGVFGIGGLGHIAVQAAQAFGADVIAVDVSEEKLEFAKSLGARETFLSLSADSLRGLRQTGGVHAALVTSAAKAAYHAAFSSLKPGGTLIMVGLPAEDICFPPILMAGREIRLQASAVGTRQDLVETLAMAAGGKIRAWVVSHPLGEANEVMERVRSGRVIGRAVLIPR